VTIDYSTMEFTDDNVTAADAVSADNVTVDEKDDEESA
jgi:hypothetical protein